MPKNGLDVYFTITDGGSATLAKISDKTKALDKDTQALAQSYAALKKANEPLIRQQAELEKQLDAAKQKTKNQDSRLTVLVHDVGVTYLSGPSPAKYCRQN